MSIYLRGKSYYYDFLHKGQRYTGSIGPVSRTVAKEEEARKKAEVIEHRLNPAKALKSPRFDAFGSEYLERRPAWLPVAPILSWPCSKPCSTKRSYGRSWQSIRGKK